MDISEKLPKDYFEETPLVVELEEESLYGQFEPQSDNDVESIYEVGGQEEEEVSINSTPTPIQQNNPGLKINTPDYVNESEEQVMDTRNQIQDVVKSNDDELLEKIKNIDDKLFSLEKSLYDPESTSVASRDKIEEVYNNFFKDELVTRDFSRPTNTTNVDESVMVNKEEVNPDYVTNDSLLSQENFITSVDNENDENIIEINNTKQDNYNESINNEIIKLNNERKELIKNLSSSKNVKSQNNLYNNKSTFIPNFQYNTTDQDDSIKTSLMTEQIFNGGDEVKLVSDSQGTPAFISKEQINLQNAIKEHGGVESAVKDSVDKQNFVKEFLNGNVDNSNSSTSFFNNTTKVDNNDSAGTVNANSFDQITKNTFNTVVAIKELSKNINSLSNALNKNFSGLNGSLKDLKSSQNNIVNNINNNKNYSSNSNNSMGGDNSPSGNIIPNVRGNTPLSTDLPEGMVMRGSNLTNRFNE